ncbi:MAG: YdcF family protein, partial [Schwartzia sp.]|nr:YdcF family protein [Schwartzia sp. (in: firmicutes)]
MISFLKFGVTFALPPGLFMLFFLWMGFRLWRRRQKEIAGAIFVVTLILYAISTPYLSAALMRNLEAAYPLPENPSGDVIALL